MRHFLCFLIALLSGTLCLRAQPTPALYMPRDITRAFQNGTRSMDGNPGRNYWQNTASYAIQVMVKPPGRQISGSEDIVYQNASPDTLKSLLFSMIQDAHLPNAARNVDVDSAYFSSGFQIDQVQLAGKELHFEPAEEHFTRQMLPLPNPLAPGSSLTLHLTWHYTLTASQGDQPRDGLVDETTFFLAYFYPRIAAYDDYAGWDNLDFTELQEFYNDFCNYEVSVTVPSDYTVWGTGILANESEVLNPKELGRLQASEKTDSVVHIVKEEDLIQTDQVKPGWKTWIWKAEQVTDVAFGLSNHYLWDATSVVVDSAGRRVSVQAAYNKTATDFTKAVSVARFSIDKLSHEWPGYAFPFPKETIFNGLSAMEYPMMVNDFTDPDEHDMMSLTDHEVAHSFFPFFMGINESRYAFMDEGWAAFFELLQTREQMPVPEANALWSRFYVNRWITDNSPGVDLPIITPSNELKDPAYERNSYGKPALAYLALKDMLGDELFGKCLREYIRRWNGKHPTPYDFFNTFNNVAGKDLNWFWKNWFFENNYPDISLKEVYLHKGGVRFTLENPGGFAVPITLKLRFLDNTTALLHETPEIWKNKKQIQILYATKNNLVKVEVVHDVFLDVNLKNEVW